MRITACSLLIATLFLNLHGFSSAHANSLNQPSQPLAEDTEAAESLASTDANYSELPTILENIPAPNLPDVTVYTEQWMTSKLPVSGSSTELIAPQIEVRSIYKADGFREFIKNDRAVEWIKRQADFPVVIFLKAGVVTLSDIQAAVSKKHFEQLSEGKYISRLPILVHKDATLVIQPINGLKQTLLLSQEKGAFLINTGTLFFFGSELIGWDEKNQTESLYKTDEQFRPFFVAWGVSTTYLYDSYFGNLGYFAPKSYGITFTANGETYRSLAEGKPNAWIVDCTFDAIYYGYYSFDVEDNVIVGNRYIDNIIYGIDPHDYSRRLIIANNHVTGTQQKHGIIVSREVDDSWIFNNVSENNKLNGFVLDRQSSNNAVAFNRSTNNGGDGLSIYESPSNLIYGNVFMNNAKHGIRIRNSADITSSQNVIKGNLHKGIYLYTQTFTEDQRNLKYDSYEEVVQLNSINDHLLFNSGGAIASDKIYETSLSNPTIKVSTAGKSAIFGGALKNYSEQLLESLLKNSKAVEITPIVKKD